MSIIRRGWILFINVQHNNHVCFCQGDGKKAEAVATVLAAVDQARVRKPTHAEMEEDADVRHEEMLATKQKVTSKKEMLLIPPETPMPTTEKSVHVTQVRSI